MLVGLVLVAAGITVVSFVVKPSTARSFDLFYGSIFIDDNTSPVAVDLASGKPTVRLTNAYAAVSAQSTGQLSVVPLDGDNTLMLAPATGEFNMVDSTGFVVKTTGGGVLLPRATGATTSRAVPSGQNAFIVRDGTATTTIYLVGTSTVASASGTSARAKARAYATVNAPLADVSSPAASANGGLWVLTDAGGANRLTELTVPRRSNAGATLRPTPRGTTPGVAGVASATRNSDGSGGDVVGLATARSVRVFDGGSERTVAVDAGPGIDRILAARGARGALVFLYHGSDGWSRVRVPAATGVAAVARMTAVGNDALLVTPAQSDGRTYTMNADNGALWQVDPDGRTQAVPGVPRYPFRNNESQVLSSPEVIASGSRVIFNSRSNYEAAVVFSDGSHEPRVIDKRSAVEVDPTGASALADSADTGKAPTKNDAKPTGKPTKRPTQTINNKINCRNTTQVPHQPLLAAGDRASRSIGLTWTYTKLDPTDCIPSTYAVAIKTVTPGAPSISGRQTVQGQTGVTLTGLFPATEYEVTVTAYINKQSATSLPIHVTTGPEGPAAPTEVRASTDSRGNWTVSWNSCGGIKQGCVPSTTWNVIPRFCDGRGLSGVPDPLSFAADDTVHTFSKQYPGSTALLGRGLCFQVQGVSPQGTVGDTSKSTAVTYSWAPPELSAMHLSASQPATTSFGATSTTTAALDLGSDPTSAVGGVGAKITFTLTGPDGSTSKSVTWSSGARVTQAFPGITAGAKYTVVAQVSPPNHPGSAVTTPPATVSTRAKWPAMTATATCPSADPLGFSCNLSVQISGLASSQARGETFSTVDGSQLRCGNTSVPLSASGFDPSQTPVRASVDALQNYGTCDVSIRLLEAGGGSAPQVFGGSTSGPISASVTIGKADTLNANSSAFAAGWTSDGHMNLQYTGSRSDREVDQLTLAWSETTIAPDGSSCGSGNATPTHAGVLVDVSGSCIDDQGDKGGWQISATYVERADGTPHTITVTLAEPPPNYVPPCTVAGTFEAHWNTDKENPAVAVTYQAGADDLRGCTNFSYGLHLPATAVCASAGAGNAPADASIDAKPCQPFTLTTGWDVTVTFDSARGGPQSVDVVVPETAPT